MFSLTIMVPRWFKFSIGEMDYGYLYGVSLCLGERQWSWVRPTEKRRKAEATNG